MRWTEAEMNNQMNKIHCIDCLEFMRKVPDNYFDLCLTDPPYGININKMNYVISGAKKVGKAFRNDYSSHNTEWDNNIPSVDIFNEIKRVSKNQIIFGGNYFTEMLEPTPSWLIWDKKVEDKYSNDFADCEMAWTSYKKPAKIYRFLYSGMIQQNMKNKEKRYHPTQKPVELFKMILNDYAIKNGYKKIFDPFAGSGTTPLACKSLGLEWCACELEHDYVQIANDRLKAVQMSIFAFDGVA